MAHRKIDYPAGSTNPILSAVIDNPDFLKMTDEQWDRFQAYTDNWDEIEPVPWVTGPILGGLVDE